MKEIVEYFVEQNIVFPKLEHLDNKTLGVKSRFTIYKAIDMSKRYCLILHIQRKSRFLQADAKKINTVASQVMQILGHNFAKKYIYIQSPLCSKANILLGELDWKVYL